MIYENNFSLSLLILHNFKVKRMIFENNLGSMYSLYRFSSCTTSKLNEDRDS